MVVITTGWGGQTGCSSGRCCCSTSSKLHSFDELTSCCSDAVSFMDFHGLNSSETLLQFLRLPTVYCKCYFHTLFDVNEHI